MPLNSEQKFLAAHILWLIESARRLATMSPESGQKIEDLKALFNFMHVSFCDLDSVPYLAPRSV